MQITNNKKVAPDAIVIPGATETTMGVVLCKDQENQHERLSSGDLIVLETQNTHKLERNVVLGILTNVTWES